MDFKKIVKGLEKRQIEKKADREHQKLLTKNLPAANKICDELAERLAALGYYLVAGIVPVSNNKAQGEIQLVEMSLEHYERKVVNKDEPEPQLAGQVMFGSTSFGKAPAAAAPEEANQAGQ